MFVPDLSDLRGDFIDPEGFETGNDSAHSIGRRFLLTSSRISGITWKISYLN